MWGWSGKSVGRTGNCALLYMCGHMRRTYGGYRCEAILKGGSLPISICPIGLISVGQFTVYVLLVLLFLLIHVHYVDYVILVLYVIFKWLWFSKYICQKKSWPFGVNVHVNAHSIHLHITTVTLSSAPVVCSKLLSFWLTRVTGPHRCSCYNGQRDRAIIRF